MKQNYKSNVISIKKDSGGKFGFILPKECWYPSLSKDYVEILTEDGLWQIVKKEELKFPELPKYSKAFIYQQIKENFDKDFHIISQGTSIHIGHAFRRLERQLQSEGINRVILIE